MIISRAPLRVSFVGGGTDLPSFYEKNKAGGAVISLAINRYVYVTINDSFTSTYRIAYSKVEYCNNINDIEHPIIRNTLEYFNINQALEITTVADVPSGTGLGSSSSFTAALIKALDARFSLELTKKDIAEAACHIEINMCGDPIGKQDQYAAAFGGINVFEFHANNMTKVKKLKIPSNFLDTFVGNVEMFYLGKQRSASKILENQNDRASTNFNALSKMRKFTFQFGDCIENNNMQKLGELLRKNWELKKTLSQEISSKEIDGLIAESLSIGAYGAKLLGAGKTGFVMVLREPEITTELRNIFGFYKSIGDLQVAQGVEILYNG